MNREGTDQLPFSTWIMRPQTLIGLSALLLSLCGLSIAIYEASLIRQAQRASVWPYVEVSASIHRDRISLRVQNSGVGPARIRAAAVTYKGETQANWSDLIRSVVRDDTVRVRVKNLYTSFINGRVFPPDSPQETIFRVVADSGVTSPAFITLLQDAIYDHRVDVAVCFCSVYEECWISNLQNMIRRTRGDAMPNESREVDDCDSMQRSGI